MLLGPELCGGSAVVARDRRDPVWYRWGWGQGHREFISKQPPCTRSDRRTILKTLPSRKFVGGAITKHFIYFFL